MHMLGLAACVLIGELRKHARRLVTGQTQLERVYELTVSCVGHPNSVHVPGHLHAGSLSQVCV